mmetsp:Transcript_5852/g.11990  ORF Transcript_5852/g.11990 Transcript_5852/m.11990 type:complete len:280 (+) Transcript_5852:429-1268(+)
MGKVKNKIAVVTGGGSGIGAALCVELATSGARAVHVVDINSDAASRVASSLATIATHPTFQYGFDAADVGNEYNIKRVINSAWSRYGRIDIYFSNAGIFALGGIAEDEYANEEREKIWRINVMSHIYAARSLFPLWKTNNHREGIFVVTASAAGLLAQIGSLPYHVTKHSAVSIADWLAISFRQDGVSVHCLCPQAVKTNMLKTIESISEGGPAGLDGIADPKEVALVTLKAIKDGHFFILPHPEVKKYFARKSTDYDRWIRGMEKVHRQYYGCMKSKL